MRTILLTCLSALLMSGCQTANEASHNTDMNTSAADVVEANSYLGADLLSVLSQSEKSNIFISPLSLSTAMGMLYAGAEGETKTSIANVMHYPGAGVHIGLGQLRMKADRQTEPVRFGNGQGEDPQILSINNSLWVDNAFTLKPAFLDILKTDYASPPIRTDFQNTPDASRVQINDWVEDRTNDRIQDLLSPSNINQDTAVVLVNTVYMMAHWRSVFNESQTTDRDFLVDGKRREARPLMQQELWLKRAKLGDAESIEIPYANDMSMIVILPRKGDGLENLDAEISVSRIHAHREALEKAERINTDLRLPKFSLKARYDLKEPLESLGLSAVFFPARANLSGMTNDSRATVSDIIQQVFLDVNEKGTEAAAATAITVMVTSAGPPRPKPKAFYVDRPFLMLLKDNKTGVIVFMGRITNPKPKDG